MPLKNWIAPVAQATGGLFGSIISNIGQKKAQKRAFAHDRSMAEYAYAKDLDMWNRQSSWNRAMWELQNQYNLPSNMMKRLRDAGLNPNLVATQGGAGGSAASIQPATMPKYQQVRANYSFPPIDVPNALGMYQNFQMSNAQKDNVKAATDLTQQRAITEAIRQHGMGYDNAIKYANAKYSEQMMKAERDRRLLQLENMQLDKSIKKSISGLRGYELKWMRDYGMRPSDPLWYRWIMRILEENNSYIRRNP